MEYIDTTCSMEGCGREYRTRKNGGSETCPACKSSFYYWKKRRPGQVVGRRRRLALYDTRLSIWFDKDGRRKK